MFILFYIISYYFDCNDGNYAREYNMYSEFGDLYDHYKDISVNFLLIILIIYLHYKNNSSNLLKFLATVVISIFLMCCHLGCQERIYSKDDSILGNFNPLCRNTDNIKYFRFVGCGTTVAVMMIGIFLLEKHKR